LVPAGINLDYDHNLQLSIVRAFTGESDASLRFSESVSSPDPQT
jgi:hypothetical protein